jgi:predicted transcriptional regulator
MRISEISASNVDEVEIKEHKNCNSFYTLEGFSVSEDDLRSRILDALSRRGSLSFEELIAELRWSGDLRVLRRVLASMIREGVIFRKPDYSKRKMVYSVGGEI